MERSRWAQHGSPAPGGRGRKRRVRPGGWERTRLHSGKGLGCTQEKGKTGAWENSLGWPGREQMSPGTAGGGSRGETHHLLSSATGVSILRVPGLQGHHAACTSWVSRGDYAAAGRDTGV